MKIVSFIEQDEVIRRILTHCGLWKDPPIRPPPPPVAPRSPETTDPEETMDTMPDYTVFDDTCYED